MVLPECSSSPRPTTAVNVNATSPCSHARMGARAMRLCSLLLWLLPLASPAAERPLGHSIAFLRLEAVPSYFEAAVKLVRAHRLVHQLYVRPTADSMDGSAGAFNAVGTKLTDSRRVREMESPLRHVAEAARLLLPEPSFEHTLSPVLSAVIEEIIARGDAVPLLRLSQGQLLCDISDACAPLDEICRARMPPHVRFVCGMDVVVVIRHAMLPHALVRGLDVANDGKDVLLFAVNCD